MENKGVKRYTEKGNVYRTRITTRKSRKRQSAVRKDTGEKLTREERIGRRDRGERGREWGEETEERIGRRDGGEREVRERGEIKRRKKEGKEEKEEREREEGEEGEEEEER